MSKKNTPGGEVSSEVLRAYVAVVKLVANENRLRILVALNQVPRTWTELMFESKSNPKSLRDHLQLLIEHGLVEKKSDKYHITNAGRALVSLSVEKMVDVANLAASAAKAGS